MKIRRPRAPLNLGSISHGTARPEDLIPTFLDTLDSQRPRQRSHRTFISGLRRRIKRRDYFDSEDAVTDLEGLFDRLEEYAPPYFYFGAHPGDGVDMDSGCAKTGKSLRRTQSLRFVRGAERV